MSDLSRLIDKQQANRLNVQRDASGNVQFNRAISTGSKVTTSVATATDTSTTVNGTKAGNFIKVAGAVSGMGTKVGTVSLTLQTNNGTTTTTIKSTSTTGTGTTSATFTTTLDSANTPIVKAVGGATGSPGTLIIDLGVGAKIRPKDGTTSIAAP